MKTNKIIAFIFLVLTGLLLMQSYTNKDDNKSQDGSVTFDINDFIWLAGHWKGDGFGGISEEIWAEPADGAMMGMFRHVKEGKLVFYEFLLLDKDGMKLKHFNPDLKGWETKDEFVTFPKVEYSPDKLVFKGLIFEKKSENEMEIKLKLKRGEKLETEVFHMRRVKICPD